MASTTVPVRPMPPQVAQKALGRGLRRQGDRRAVGPGEHQRADVAPEAARRVVVLAVDVGRDGTADRDVAGAGGHRREPAAGHDRPHEVVERRAGQHPGGPGGVVEPEQARTRRWRRRPSRRRSSPSRRRRGPGPGRSGPGRRRSCRRPPARPPSAGGRRARRPGREPPPAHDLPAPAGAGRGGQSRRRREGNREVSG